LNNYFAFSFPKPVLHSKLQHARQLTDVQPLRGSATGQDRQTVCAMAKPHTPTAGGKEEARQQLFR